MDKEDFLSDCEKLYDDLRRKNASESKILSKCDELLKYNSKFSKLSEFRDNEHNREWIVHRLNPNVLCLSTNSGLFWNNGIYDDNNNQYIFYRDISLGHKQKVVITKINKMIYFYKNGKQYFYNDWQLEKIYSIKN